MKRVRITIEMDYETEEAFVTSHLWWYVFRKLLADNRALAYLIEEFDA